MSLSCRDPLPPAPLRPRYVYVRQELIPEEKSAAYAGAEEEVFGGGVVVAFESADPGAGRGWHILRQLGPRPSVGGRWPEHVDPAS